MKAGESRTKRQRKSHERAATGGTTVATAHENHGVGLALTHRPIKAATRCSQRAEAGIWQRVSRRFISGERRTYTWSLSEGASVRRDSGGQKNGNLS